jgi:hypothetical protein
VTKKRIGSREGAKARRKNGANTIRRAAHGNSFAIFLPLERRRTLPLGRSSLRLRAFA